MAELLELGVELEQSSWHALKSWDNSGEQRLLSFLSLKQRVEEAETSNRLPAILS